MNIIEDYIVTQEDFEIAMSKLQRIYTMKFNILNLQRDIHIEKIRYERNKQYSLEDWSEHQKQVWKLNRDNDLKRIEMMEIELERQKLQLKTLLFQ